MYRAIIVGGTFDRQSGKPSKLASMIAENTGWPCMNGGNLSALYGLDFKDFDVLVWMPNIDNAETKILPVIKQKNPHLTLISSKRVVEKTYSPFAVIDRLLKSRSNLGIMIEKQDGRYVFKLLDPLGNLYSGTADIAEFSRALLERVDKIRSLTRVPSKSLGPAGENLPAINEAFIQLARQFGDEFSKHVNAVNPERFLGNASARYTDRITRCCHGFPAFRDAGHYLVSRRNVDKATLSAGDFVAVEPDERQVKFIGEVKPSVDAPIQIRLFNYFPNVNYVIHGHVYLENAPATKSKIPCGYIEEFDEIVALFPSRESFNFGVNLKGHGCLIMAGDLDYLRKQKDRIISRGFPEP
ncbi:MAG: class II aldolase/adducin family protein [Alphaproteobacteria bacterium]|nr:class II aldolase/adducin family protein [Alphaproteobacteria bacterium]